MEYTKVLLHCDNEFYADEVSSLLEKEGIACRLHDERNDTAYSYGAHGGNLPGIEVRVNESDYERALALVKPVEEAHRQFVPWCPECGSDDVEHTVVKERRRPWGPLVLLIVLILAVLFFYKTDYLWAAIPFIAFFGAVFFFSFRTTERDMYRCRKCNHTFTRNR